MTRPNPNILVKAMQLSESVATTIDDPRVSPVADAPHIIRHVQARVVRHTPSDIRVPIQSDSDIIAARLKGRQLAADLKFSVTDLALIATAISELARNILAYAKEGEMVLRTVRRHGRLGLRLITRDDGPGIANVDAAVRDGYSTSGGLGLGLPGVRRLVDEFDVTSLVGHGTTVTVTKWTR